MPIVGKIDVKKVDKQHLFAGAKGTYLDFCLIENRYGEDRYGNLGYIVQSVSREARENGVKGPILGNWKRAGKDKSTRHIPPPANGPQPTPPPMDENIPF